MRAGARRGQPRTWGEGSWQGADIMVLSGSQHLLLALSLAVCACFLLPRMFGGGVRDAAKQDARGMPLPAHGRSSAGESQGSRRGSRRTSEQNNNIAQIKEEMEKQLKKEKPGSGHSMAFTLMPLYAVGVAIFAAYKFSKIKSNENTSKSSEDEKRKKETESQLLELERHLFQTEKMLNSLLTQLDPLSNCVNSLATEQKDEIMNQLQSIRQIMKKTGMNQATANKSENHSSKDTLEELINSLNIQNPENEEENVPKLDGEDLDLPAHDPISGEPAIQSGISHCNEENRSEIDEQDQTSGQIADGLRKRNVKD